MADEYIRKQDAVDELRFKPIFSDAWNALGEARDRIKSIKPADVAPVVHAHWIPQKENHKFKEVWMKCSACGYPVSRWTGNTNFCPNCGAKMDGKKRK